MPTPIYTLQLRILENSREIKTSMRLPIIIGRTDPNTNFRPDVDLEDYGGAEGGVSRRHLLLIPDHDTFMVKDLNTTNGSYLNGSLMKAHKIYSIEPGDELTLGRLRLRVMYAKLRDASLPAPQPARENVRTLVMNSSISADEKHDTQPKPLVEHAQRETYTPAQKAAMTLLRGIVINKQISPSMMAYIAMKATQDAEWQRNKRLAVLKTACEYGYVARDNAELMKEQRRVNEIQFGVRE